MSLMKRLAPLISALAAGCYTYAPVQLAAVQPGMGVRARISASAAEQVAPLLGMSDARVLTGTLIENSSGAIIVEVPTVSPAVPGAPPPSLSQRISIAPSQPLELESHQLDRTRTMVVAGAG